MILAGFSTHLHAQENTPIRTHTYFYDEIQDEDFARLPTPIVERRLKDRLFDGCRETNARIAPALVPIAMFFANSILGELDRALSRREEARLKKRSLNFVGTRTDTDFIFGNRVARCLVIDRFQSGFANSGDGVRTRKFLDKSIYVIIFEKVGTTAFRISDIRAKITNTPAWQFVREGDGYRANAIIGVGIRAVSNSKGTPTLVEFPEFNYTIKDLAQGKGRAAPSESIGSSVMPLPVGDDIPTTIVVSINESDVSLEKLRQQTELARQMRSSLFSAIGSSIETAISD